MLYLSVFIIMNPECHSVGLDFWKEDTFNND